MIGERQVPANYKCSVCGSVGVKLWREYNSVPVVLICATCAGAASGVDVSEMNDRGEIPVDGVHGMVSDQIGQRIPAVPVDGTLREYWGYTSVPDGGVTWWRGLPLKGGAKPYKCRDGRDGRDG